MAENESNIIEHLIEVENLAASVTLNAEEQSLKKINEAKAASEKQFHEQYTSSVHALEEDFKAKASKIDGEAEESLKMYREEISKSPLDVTAFNAAMDCLILNKKAVSE